MKDTKTQFKRSEEMFPIVKQYLESNQSQKQFCSTLKEEIKLCVFQYWLRKYKHSQSKLSVGAQSSFVPIELDPPSLPLTQTATIKFANGIVINIPVQ